MFVCKLTLTFWCNVIPGLGCAIIRICGITIIADYCLESITINRLIGDLDRRYSVSYDVVQQIKRYYYYKC